MDNKTIFAQNLKNQLKLNGITQKELAGIIGVSAPTVNEWLHGKKFPRIDKIELMSNYFGIQKSVLIEDKTKTTTDNSSSPTDTFSRNLRYQMELHNKSRRDISDSLGISYFTITTWVNGSKYPRMYKVEQLAKYFGISVSDLVENKEKPTENSGLSEEKRELMAFVDSLPDEKVALALRLLKSI